MFGYVTANSEELKIKDYNFYRSCYCGLCHTLKARHGLLAPLTLSYDMTFTVLLLSALYEDSFETSYSRCIVHPTKKHPTRVNNWTEFAADMTVLLAYHNLMDDWKDEGDFSHLAFAKSLERTYIKICNRYPDQAKAASELIKNTTDAENHGITDLDLVSGYTGEFLGRLFSVKKDIWEEPLYKVGFYLGKFIYLMDAVDDLEKDKKKGSYNPLISLSQKKDFDAYIENTLLMMMAECSKNFELLPIIQYTDILRNILYSGVWSKYSMIKNQKEQKGAKKHDF